MNMPCQTVFPFDTAEYCIGYCNGTAMPNPGAMGIGGYITFIDGRRHEFSEVAGVGTSNEAEYLALIRMLNLAIENGMKNFTLHMDSQLVVDQCTGAWGVKSTALVKLKDKVSELKEAFDVLNIVWVPRRDNRAATTLSEVALIRAASESGRIAASQGVQVVEVSPDIFVAYGSSGKYVIDLDHHVCSCPDFQNRGRTAGPCKHLAAAIMKRGEMKGKE